jgi:hypothetical protein
MNDLFDLVVPDTIASSAAVEVAGTYLTPAMLSHSHRVYLWAAARAEQRGIQYDAELLFVASMFHDISLAPEFDSHTVAFEEAGGHVAHVFAAGAGWPRERRERVSEVIVRHMRFDIDAADDPEGYLISSGAAVDIAGRDADAFTPAFRAAVLQQHPRLSLVREFITCFEAQADRKPTSAAALAVQNDLGATMAANPLDR